MPIYATTFPQDFWEHNFQQGGMAPPLESPMHTVIILFCLIQILHCANTEVYSNMCCSLRITFLQL